MAEFRKSLPSLLLYAAGLVALMMCDLAASAWLGVDDLATWSRIRSLFYFYGSITLMGVDQILVRRPRLAPAILAMFRWQVPILILLLSAGLHMTGYLPFWLALASSLSAALSSIGNLLCLGRDQRTASQFHVQIWKLITFAALGSYIFGLVSIGLITLLTVAFGLAALASALPLLRHRRRQLPWTALQRDRVGWAYRLGRRYVLSTSLAAMAIYAETLLLNLFTNQESAAIYFAHLSFFVLPLSAVGGYLSFIGVPLMRRGSIDPAQLDGRRFLALILATATLTFLFELLGWLAWKVADPAIGPVIPALWIIATCGAFLRLLYIPLSVYFSAYGDIELHNKLIFGQTIAIAAASFFLLVETSSGQMAMLIAIPLAGLAHLALRVLFGGALIWRHIRSPVGEKGETLEFSKALTR